MLWAPALLLSGLISRDNRIKRMPRGVFKKLPNVNYFDVAENLLSALGNEFSDWAFGTNVNRGVHFGDNPLTSIFFNNITQPLPIDELCKLSNLRGLTLRNVRSKLKVSAWIGIFKQLESLRLQDCWGCG